MADIIGTIKKDNALRQLFYYMALLVVFETENLFIPGKYNIHSPLDDMIPFIPAFVIPYFLWYFFLIGTGLYFLFNSKEDFRKTFLSINLCTLIAVIVYALFPNYLSLRPLTYGGDFFSQWVKWLQWFDSATSVCPSLHVAVCLSLYFGVINCNKFKNRLLIKISALILTVMICISTLYIKQHSVIDVVTGVLLGIVVYVYVYKIKEGEKNGKDGLAENSDQQVLR